MDDAPASNDLAAEATPSGPASSFTRRDFVRSAGVTSAGVAIAGATVGISRLTGGPKGPTGPATSRDIPDLPTVPAADADVLVRMQAELRTAMAKPVEERRWQMVIDTRKCVGCHACTVACIAENKLPPGVVYRPVLTETFGEYPNVQMRFFPRPCMQCAEPPCVPVCPVNATYTRPDGIVAIDYDRCIGCRYCVQACPYGARTSDFGLNYTDGAPARQPYERLANHEYGANWNRENHGSPVGNARKCHFCLHRIEAGLLPACVTTCIGRATYFGDANEPTSLVSQLARLPNQVRLLEQHHTKPTVFYLV